MLFIYLFMAVLGLRCRSGFSLVAVPGLLTVVASLIVEHGLWGARALEGAACGLSSCGSRALERRLSSCRARA